jgi:hypothetical protein
MVSGEASFKLMPIKFVGGGAFTNAVKDGAGDVDDDIDK